MASCIIDFDDTRRDNGSTSDALAEIITSYKMITRLGYPIHGICYPSCLTPIQKNILKSVVPEALLREVHWHPGKPDDDDPEQPVAPANSVSIRVNEQGPRYVVFDH